MHPTTRLLRPLLGLLLSLCAGAAAADVVVVVSARSPVTALSKNQIVDIFLGKTAEFPSGQPAVPIDQAEASPLRDEFYARFAGKTAAQIKAHWSKIVFTGRGQPPREAASSLALRQSLLDNPDAVGYIESSLVDARLRVLQVP